MPPTPTLCRSCGQTTDPGRTYCVACAVRQADSDALVFDRWLGRVFGGAGLVIVLVATYAAARYLNLLGG